MIWDAWFLLALTAVFVALLVIHGIVTRRIERDIENFWNESVQKMERDEDARIQEIITILRDDK